MAETAAMLQRESRRRKRERDIFLGVMQMVQMGFFCRFSTVFGCMCMGEDDSLMHLCHQTIGVCSPSKKETTQII